MNELRNLEARVLLSARSVAAASELGQSWSLSECLRLLRAAVEALDGYAPPPPSAGGSLAHTVARQQRIRGGKRTTRPTPGAVTVIRACREAR